MPALHVTPIPAFNDNYIWAITTPEAQTVIVDPGDAAPVEQWLDDHKVALSAILITHHHADHTGGLTRLLERYPDIPVYGPSGGHIPLVNRTVQNDDALSIFGHHVQVLAVPGHTLDHLAYLFTEESAGKPESGAPAPLLFCGDTLFAAGCGRLFEGSPDMMYTSLQRLTALPATTQVYCAHEYTLSNLRFALAAEPDNQALSERMTREQKRRDQGIPTLPSTISLEQRTNPFLRCHSVCLQKTVTAWAATQKLSPPGNDRETFALLRRWKDQV